MHSLVSVELEFEADGRQVEEHVGRLLIPLSFMLCSQLSPRSKETNAVVIIQVISNGAVCVHTPVALVSADAFRD